MNPYEKFRKESKQENASSAKNLITIAGQKHTLNHAMADDNFAGSSSISLPIWNAARLKRVHLNLKSRGLKISRTDLIIMVMKLYATKMRNQEPKVNRLRKKNSHASRFVKISTYSNLNQWDYLQITALNAKVCFSHVVDIALRMYLRLIERRLLEPVLNQQNTKWSTASNKNVFLRSIRNRTKNMLLKLGKYQKKIEVHSRTKLVVSFSLTRERTRRVPPFKNHTFSQS